MHRVLIGNTCWTSPYVFSCFVALRHKGLSFVMQDVALDTGVHHGHDFAKQSLTSRVPVLIEDGFALSESSAIIEYLEETYPAPDHPRLLPQERVARARARQVMAWLRSDLEPLRHERSAEYVFYPHAELAAFEPLSDRGLRAAAKLLAAAEQLVPEDTGPLFGAWCIADTELAMMLQRLLRTGHPVPERLAGYAQAQWQHPAAVEYREHARPQFRRALPQY